MHDDGTVVTDHVLFRHRSSRIGMVWVSLRAICLAILAVGGSVSPVGASTARADTTFPSTIRVSVAADGAQVEYAGESGVVDVSADGNLIAFSSGATNVVPEDANGDNTDIYVRDVQAGTTTLVSVASDGTQPSVGSFEPAITPDGRSIVFTSPSHDLDPTGRGGVFVHDLSTGDTTIMSVDGTGVPMTTDAAGFAISDDARYLVFGAFTDDPYVSTGLFVHDSLAGSTVRVDVGPGDVEANAQSFSPAISADGRYVAFASYATNLDPNATEPFVEQVYLHDMTTDETSLISASTGGAEGDAGSAQPTFSTDGHLIAFSSLASNLVPDDTNGVQDVFTYDLSTHETQRVSVTGSGLQVSAGGDSPSLSADATSIAFRSSAPELVPPIHPPGEYIVVKDLVTGRTKIANVAADGFMNGGGGTLPPRLSGDGRYVVFVHSAALVPDDTNHFSDVFRRDTTAPEGSPDAWLRRSGGSWIGDGIYRRRGVQARRIRLAQGSTATFQVRMENEAPDTDGLLLRTSTSVPGFHVTYWAGSTDITSEVVAADRLTALPAGDLQTFTVRIKVLRRTPPETVGRLAMSVVSENQPGLIDTVKIFTTARTA
jgi:Tol biopolymer transport system component